MADGPRLAGIAPGLISAEFLRFMSEVLMSPETWKIVKKLFNEAVELDPAELDSFIAANADAGEDVIAELRSLLAASATGRFDRPVAKVGELWSADSDEESLAGKTVGDYRLVRRIGRGGMGVVFEAVRHGEDFEQRVALKVLRAGLDSEPMIRRFGQERKILASLEHPNIARLLDGGRDDAGNPFLAMEFVEGMPIDDYCATRSLGISARLRLFLQVCSAVSFAHSRLVVHRDLKPSNILITENGTAKLLDFGISKIITDEELPAQTVTSLGMMTPQYASPEQVSGDVVSTPSDVYSLGMVLYELLTGIKAYRFPSNRADEIARVVCEVEPARPSTVVDQPKRRSGELFEPIGGTNSDRAKTTVSAFSASSKELRGDLDNIVLKALAKDPARRYSSVEQFAADVERHLDGLPVSARPDTVAYRFGKFVRRHRIAVGAGAVAVLALIAGIGATSWQAHRAEQQRQLAERRFNEVRELANNVVFKYHDEIKDLPGSTRVRELLVADALKYLDGLRRDSGDNPALARELAQAYMRIASVQGGTYQANLGNSEAAAASYQHAIELLEPLAAGSSDVKLLSELRDAYVESGRAFFRVGNFELQNRNFERSLELGRRVIELAPDDINSKIYLARSFVHYGDSIPDAEAERRMETFRKAMKMAEEVIALAPDDETANRILATATHRVQLYTFLDAEKAKKAGDETRRLELLREALTITKISTAAQMKVFAMKPDNAVYKRNVAGARLNEGKIYRELGDYKVAIRLASEALEIQLEIAAADPNNNEIKLDLKESYEDLSLAFVGAGEINLARQNHQRSVDLSVALLTKDPNNFDFLIARLRGEQVFADALLGAGRRAEAKAVYLGALKLVSPDIPEKYASFVADFRSNVNESLVRCG